MSWGKSGEQNGKKRYLGGGVGGEKCDYHDRKPAIGIHTAQVNSAVNSVYCYSALCLQSCVRTQQPRRVTIFICKSLPNGKYAIFFWLRR